MLFPLPVGLVRKIQSQKWNKEKGVRLGTEGQKQGEARRAGRARAVETGGLTGSSGVRGRGGAEQRLSLAAKAGGQEPEHSLDR